MRYQQKYRVAVWKTLTLSKTEQHNINKGYVCNQWQAFFSWYWTGLFRNLKSTRKIKTTQVALYSMEYLNEQYKSNVCAVLSVGILLRISIQFRHHTAGLSGSDVRLLLIYEQHMVR